MKKKTNNIYLLIGLMIVFSIIFFIALLNINSSTAFFNIGIPPGFENFLIMILSAGSVFKIIYEIYKTE